MRGIEVFAGPLRAFEPERAPANPVRLFLSWLSDAVADGLRDPHAMTLSTVDEAGDPDARGRSATARTESLLARQSQYLADTAERDHALEKALALVGREPSLVDSAWTLYTLAPVEVEFWQAAKSRVHTRLRYERTGTDGRWERYRLWS
ncbi:hypothetical protein ADK93_08995 [Streptomyces sp. XY58]|nr:hypothetical protein ADK93_08995 [Streptomyces sp. XY58]KOV04530.1 hypothetical protein ADK89_23225 [Streptomyces sp. XY37]KOV46116.1 hypothetical protein ADK99_22615 [Streptomyces sp. MMG1064]